MQKKEISIEGVDPLIFFGVENANWNVLKSAFSKMHLVARGNSVQVSGNIEDVGRFEAVIRMIVWNIERYNTLSEDDVLRLCGEDESNFKKSSSKDETLVYGPGGNRIVARTKNQFKLVDAIRSNDMVFAIGPAGTGKTYTAVAMAVAALKDKRVKKIILTRPAVEAGENLGFLPGDLKEKLDPYLQPLYDALTDMLPYEKVADHLEKGVIEIAPLAFMRGRTLDKAFVILDEAQNTTIAQIKMFLTRMGKDAKFVITGDASQIDLPRKQTSGLKFAQSTLTNIEGIEFIQLDGNDVIRHRLVKAVIKAFDQASTIEND
ncbi:MAG: PhoH family protein [Bacteroidetes bacterium]|nr:PhoH family protein [Bacteroidota bacterium]MDA1335910.1 PhoH family protein [Bacteroidota bacterium]